MPHLPASIVEAGHKQLGISISMHDTQTPLAYACSRLYSLLDTRPEIEAGLLLWALYLASMDPQLAHAYVGILPR